MPFKFLPYADRTPVACVEFIQTWCNKSEVKVYFGHLHVNGSSSEKMALVFITSLLNRSNYSMLESAFYEYGHMIMPPSYRVDDVAKRKYYERKLKDQTEMMERTWQLVDTHCGD